MGGRALARKFRLGHALVRVTTHDAQSDKDDQTVAHAPDATGPTTSLPGTPEVSKTVGLLARLMYVRYGDI